MSRPTLFTGENNTQGRDLRSALPSFSVHSTWSAKTPDQPADNHSVPGPFASRPQVDPGRTDSVTYRQDDLDHRENQPNARMAQFETLVRNTKVSLQTKMEEIAQREDELRKGEEQMCTYRTTFDEQIERHRRESEQDLLDLQTRKQAVEDRLIRRERELSEIATEREREVAIQAEAYRQQLETQLVSAKSDYQSRFELRCRDIESEFAHRLAEEKRQLEQHQRTVDEAFDSRVRLLDKEIEQKKTDIEDKYKSRFEEMDRQVESRKKEVDEAGERRIAAINEDYLQKRNELEERYARREEQLERRELLVQQAEEECNQRMATFENQWNDLENLRKTKSEELTRRETNAEERERHIVETEARLKKKEMELAALAETTKAKELQTALEAKKYVNLQEMMVAAEESQAENFRIREALVRERQQIQKTNESERKRLRDAQELALKRVEEERRDLVNQNKRLEQMRLALDRSREELGKMHRETLEVRLATEELWLRLAGDTGSEDLKKSVGKIQARLASEYQSAVARLEVQKQELKQSQDDQREQQEKLLVRKAQMDQLVARAESAMTERERDIKTREEELDCRQERIEEQMRRIQQERAEMEHEVRILQTQIDAAFEKNAA